MGNNLSPYQNLSYFTRVYGARGFSAVPGSTQCTQGSGSCLSYFEKSDTRMIVSAVSRQGRTGLVVVTMRK